MARFILAADIGGTNSRFAGFKLNDNGRLALTKSTWLSTQEADSLQNLLDGLEQSGFSLTPDRADAVVLAVPGPVRRGVTASLANVSWSVDIEPLRKAFNQDNMFLINDFAAQVLACRTEAVAEALEVKAGWPENGGPLAAIGAGTGLGHAALIPNGRGGFIPAPSEAGHASFTFTGPEELDFEAFLLDQTGRPYPYGDLVVSGSGLAWLHQWLTGKEMSPPEVAETINAKSRTTRLFARFYGRAARNYALTVLPLGGLYVAGGVAAQNPFLVTCTDFREEFTHSVHYQRLLRQLPVFLNTNEDSGLYGAAYWAQMRLDRLI